MVTDKDKLVQLDEKIKQAKAQLVALDEAKNYKKKDKAELRLYYQSLITTFNNTVERIKRINHIEVVEPLTVGNYFNQKTQLD